MIQDSLLSKLVESSWISASFMSEYKNSSLWGSYANGHTGMCLIFALPDSVFKFQPSDCTGNIEPNNHSYLREIKYKKHSENFLRLDFFKSMGRTPYPKLENWIYEYPDLKSKVTNIYKDEEKFRKKYWSDFEESIHTKTNDWSFENEYRITRIGWSEKDLKGEELIYNLDSLVGIIFGINTSSENKMKALEIMRSKEPKEFKFYQAYYSACGAIECAHIDIQLN